MADRRYWSQQSVAFSTREKLALDDLIVLTGYASRADVIRLALQRLADHYDYDRNTRVFAIRKRRDPRHAKLAASA